MSTTASVILLLGRIFFVAMAGWPVGIWLIVAILSVVLGIWPDVGMLMIAAFLIPTTVLFHPYWTFSDPAQRRTHRGAFYRNITLLGATLALFASFTVAGAGQFAITGSLINLR